MDQDSPASPRSVWNPDQYALFRDERSQPFFDLLALVRPLGGGRAVDLGCGTGDLTRVLHERTGARSTTGIDNAPAMLARARAHAGDGLTFRAGDIAAFQPRTVYRLVFSNAALQWVTGHEDLFPRLAGTVARGGQLAVQMPANHGHVSHTLAHELAGEEPFRTALGGYIRPMPVREPDWYAALLDRLGFRDQHVRLQVYGHHLESREGVIEWVKGTLLTDYERRLSPALYQQYLARYRELLLPRLDDARPYFYTFPRILLWACR